MNPSILLNKPNNAYEWDLVTAAASTSFLQFSIAVACLTNQIMKTWILLSLFGQRDGLIQ